MKCLGGETLKAAEATGGEPLATEEGDGLRATIDDPLSGRGEGDLPWDAAGDSSEDTGSGEALVEGDGGWLGIGAGDSLL